MEACSGAHYWGREFSKLGHRIGIVAAEFGIVMPTGRYTAQAAIPGILENAENGLPILARQIISDVFERINQANEQTLSYDREMSRLGREDENAKRLMSIPGVGELVATGVVASVPDVRMFKNSRQFAAWLGLAPRQYSTGGDFQGS